ncbi:unnamed protein product [Clonostachys rosea f. rosea IK726]|uniref:Uncharacterized protein n=1 Tax=Clonostachys rosea f. rosea IK726 TaxID=1349383 RepID=A0ACA9UAR7_BIOOC|nr:unnamed protein product [Clonostachys rosea f. rosea IK726]
MVIQIGDFDVAPPALSDFSEPSLQAKAFIEHVKLCKIIGRVSQLLNSGASLNSDESSALKVSLCQWIRRLPRELSLYDATGLRQPYKKEVTGLHLVYFTAIILLQAATRGYNSQWRASPISLLASSCIARLYEETQLREDVCFLIHIHSFYCMVGAIPLLYWRTRSHSKENCRLEELGILRSTVEQLSTRFGGAGTVLRNMEALEAELQQRRSDSSIDDMMQVEENIIAGDGEQIEELFPFPLELCPNMDLLDPAGAVRMEESLNITHSFVQDLPEWIFEDASSFPVPTLITPIRICVEVFDVSQTSFASAEQEGDTEKNLGCAEHRLPNSVPLNFRVGIEFWAEH